MKRDWFYQDNLTEEQAEELVARYRANNITVEKSLDIDPRFWVVSAFLPVSALGGGNEREGLQHHPAGQTPDDPRR